jgi:predicted phage tail protein
MLRVTRITLNQNSNKIADTMQIAGYTEVIDAKLRYRYGRRQDCRKLIRLR